VAVLRLVETGGTVLSNFCLCCWRWLADIITAGIGAAIDIRLPASCWPLAGIDSL
jgi:hypothetical protein